MTAAGLKSFEGSVARSYYSDMPMNDVRSVKTRQLPLGSEPLELLIHDTQSFSTF